MTIVKAKIPSIYGEPSLSHKAVSNSAIYTNSIFNNKHKTISTESTKNSLSNSLNTAAKWNIGLAVASGAVNVFSAVSPLLLKKSQANNPDGTNNKSQTKLDVKDLNKAIDDCKNNGKVDELKEQITQKQQTYDTNQTKIDTMLDAPTKAQKEASTAFANATNDYNKEKTILKQDKKDEQTAKGAFSQASNAYEAASTKYDSAVTSYNDAKNAYESAPADPAEQKAALKIAMDSAEATMKTAETEKNEAKEVKDQKEKEYKAAQNERSNQEDYLNNDCYNAVKESKANLDIANKALTTAKSQQGQLKTDNVLLKETLDKAQNALPDYIKKENNQNVSPDYNNDKEKTKNEQLA